MKRYNDTKSIVDSVESSDSFVHKASNSRLGKLWESALDLKSRVNYYARCKLDTYQDEGGIPGLTVLGYIWWSTVDVCTKRPRGIMPSMR